MKITRRSFIRLSVFGSLAAGVSAWWWKTKIFYTSSAPLTQDEKNILIAYVDLLIPRDETPGAIDLGVEKQLFDKAEWSKSLRKRIRQGCQWLERESRAMGATGFLALTTEQQLKLIERSAQARNKTTVKEFYQRVRNEAFSYYYAHPEIWASLCYSGPPQPRGYPDYHEPPTRCG